MIDDKVYHEQLKEIQRLKYRAGKRESQLLKYGHHISDLCYKEGTEFSEECVCGWSEIKRILELMNG